MTASIDWLVLTAANHAQARGYEAQLAARARDGRLRSVRNWLVVADPCERRAGSGGSTFVVLHELARRIGREQKRSKSTNPFIGQRILILHSGGDSRRLPAYAAEGKIFVPAPRMLQNEHASTLFDLILADLSPLVRDSRVLVATGDVLLGVGTHDPDLEAPGMVGVAFPGSPSVGCRHGVYVCNPSHSVTDFLQKPDLATARRRRAVDRRGRVLIDTGVLSLDANSALKWTRASAPIVRRLLAGRGEAIDLYSDLLPSLYGRASATNRFDRFRVPFRCAVVPPCAFLHIGSTLELLSVATRSPSNTHRAVTLNSIVAAPLSQHPTSFIESSRITHPSRLGNHGMLVGFPGGFPFHLDSHLGVVFLPIGRSDWTCITFGVKDDFKTPFSGGGTLWNSPLSRNDAAGVEGSLWDLACWVVGPLPFVVHHSRWMFDPNASSPRHFPHRWSMAELMPRVNLHRLLAHRQRLQSELNAAAAMAQLRRGEAPPSHFVRSAVESQHASIARLVATRLRTERNPFTRARLHHLSAVLSPSHAARQDSLSFQAVADAVATAHPPPPPARRAAITRTQIVTATAPVRIDLCGGWSDTPPICHELGGTVVNVAVSLEGEQPIRVSARLIDEPILRLRSEDLNTFLTVAHTRDALTHHDPHDWAALPKAALILAGITPRQGSLRQRLLSFGGGIELTMSVAVPKGSGLGTSSILGAAVLACLDRVCGHRSSTRSLIIRTSILEQMMSTAGGWQDQAGGISPGVKILRTRPGMNQVPRTSPINIPPRTMRELQNRSLLYYTGQRRLAKDILQGVVRRYLSGDPEVIRIIHDLKTAAETMARDLQRGDVDRFARGLLRNWDLKKSIDPGSTNDRIEAILEPLVPRLSGYELSGAGGGGFIYMIARTAHDAATLRTRLSRRRATGGRLVAFDFDQRGLTVEVTAANRG